eukprot:TRINITY_DN19625_c0_g1_i4.p4 TRINITY_DN19625_c0_g1~~TRINITY_DN19625_c0_g1_i4.p4  ORF type:complete len:127 (+),score=1.33 TRINITY_DN19625_c0_g1_i4:876-1256(+)
MKFLVDFVFCNQIYRQVLVYFSFYKQKQLNALRLDMKNFKKTNSDVVCRPDQCLCIFYRIFCLLCVDVNFDKILGKNWNSHSLMKQTLEQMWRICGKILSFQFYRDFTSTQIVVLNDSFVSQFLSK